VPPRAPIY